MIEIGTVYWFVLPDKDLAGVGAVTHVLKDRQIMLARYFDLLTSSPPSREDLERVLGEGVIAYSALDSAYGFKEGILRPFSRIELPVELTVWPHHYSAPFYPGDNGRLILTNPNSLVHVSVTPIHYVPDDPLIPGAGVGSLDSPGALATMMLEKGLISQLGR